eukprot:3459118-Rhodomonas_salina.2
MQRATAQRIGAGGLYCRAKHSWGCAASKSMGSEGSDAQRESLGANLPSVSMIIEERTSVEMGALSV